MDLMFSVSMKNVNTFSSGLARSPSDVRIMQITPAMLLISVTAVKPPPPTPEYLKYDNLQWKVVHPKVPAGVTMWLLIILRTRKSNKLHIGVFMYSERDWSTEMGGFLLTFGLFIVSERRGIWGDGVMTDRVSGSVRVIGMGGRRIKISIRYPTQEIDRRG